MCGDNHIDESSMIIHKYIHNYLNIVKSNVKSLKEIIHCIIFILIFTFFLLVISHFLIAGEFGLLYWSYKRGWLWN